MMVLVYCYSILMILVFGGAALILYTGVLKIRRSSIINAAMVAWMASVGLLHLVVMIFQ